jgi:hypothetical protein
MVTTSAASGKGELRIDQPPRHEATKKKLLGFVPLWVIPGVVAITLSVCAFLYFFTLDMTNVYGDGVAHVNIARKVVDSLDHSPWQRYIQIGSPWLPLQTVLMLPLVINDRLWRTGAAGSIVSMISFVVAGLSLYFFSKRFYGRADGWLKEALPMLSFAIFALNPSALYLQSTPMTELIFMGAMMTAVCLLQRWSDEQSVRRLAAAAVSMTVATLSRYEAWPVAALSVLIVCLASRGDVRQRLKNSLLFAAVVALGPIYWLWHNWAIYGNALEFLTGPNSARGISIQNQATLGWSRIFVGHAALDILIIAVAVAVCAGPLVLLLSAAGFVKWSIAERKSLLKNSPALLLLAPFLFHVFSLYRGEIQVFPLSAFGLHNVRYGLPHLLGVGLFAPASVLIFKGGGRRWAMALVCLLIAVQYGCLISDGPSQLAVYQEGFRNGVNAPAARERARAAAFLIADPPEPLTVMHTGALGPLVSKGGMRFSEIVHEGTTRWHQLVDGIPADVRTVIIQEGDPLALRLLENPALARDLAGNFHERFSVGEISVFSRK